MRKTMSYRSIFFMITLSITISIFGTTTIASSKSIKEVSVVRSVSENHTAIVTTDGELWMCGRNLNGQLGDGTTTERDTPVKIMTGVKTADVETYYTAIIKTDGSLWMCGDNRSGQLGDGTTTERHTPVKIMTDVEAVSCGLFYTAILKRDGSLWMCGKNEDGQLGDGTTTERHTPVKIMNDVKAVSCGKSHTAILKTDGSLWMCGWNGSGALGDGTTDKKTTPVKIMMEVMAISMGGEHSAVLKKDGSLWMYGNNECGQYGNGTKNNPLIPVKVMTDVKAVSSGALQTAILKTDGTLWMCGWNDYGQLGDGTTTERHTPVKIMSDVKAVSTGGDYTAILKTDGTLWMCGSNYRGYFGDGTAHTSQYKPVQIKFGDTLSPQTYKVTFDPNGGKVSGSASKNVTENKTYEALPGATRTNYVFLGWFTQKTGGTQVTEKTSVTLSEDQTLYAHWDKVKTTSDSPKNPKAVLIKYNKVKLTWNKVSGANSYIIYRKIGNGTYKKYRKTDKNTYTDSSLKEGTQYSYYIKAVDSKKKEGSSSKAVTVTTIGTVTGVTTKAVSNSNLSVAWGKTAGASNYQISMSTSKLATKDQGSVGSSVLSKTITAKAGETYYIKIRAYQTVAGKKIYGNWSSVLTYTFSYNPGQRTAIGSSAKVREIKGIQIDDKYHTSSGQYSDSYFASSKVNNNKLIKISALAAASTYGDQTEPFLKICGFNNRSHFYTGSQKKGTEKDNDHCTVYIGSKTGEFLNEKGEKTKKPIIAIIINGYSEDHYEWISNFNLGENSSTHEGFYKATNEAYSKVISYCKKEEIDLSNSIVWITGHSRGAAITNILAYRISRDFSDPLKTEIFAYGFATPNVSKSPNILSTKRIINIVNRGDFVPYVPLKEWGFGKPGETKIFTVSSKTKRIYKKYTGGNLRSMSLSERQKLINAFNKCCNYSQKGFYKRFLGVSAYDYMTRGLAKLMTVPSKNKIAGTSYMLSSAELNTNFLKVNAFFLVNQLINPKILGAHDMATYLAYTDTLP